MTRIIALRSYVETDSILTLLLKQVVAPSSGGISQRALLSR
jgi:hypothetical protein